MATSQKLIVIVGETASGKSSLALELARLFNGEIIAADSRTVYKGMDIGTAKPSLQERKLVRHHLLDVVDPSQLFTAADFKRLANEAINDINSRGKLPIMAGGSGLYVDSVIFDYQFSKQNAERDPLNPRHLKKTSDSDGPKILRPNTLVIGISVPTQKLKERVEKRVESMMKAGLIDEIRGVSAKYGWEIASMNGIGYREWRDYFAGNKDIDTAKHDVISSSMNLAKKQRTWFKRNKSIHWVESKSEAVDLITTFLNKN